MGYAVYLHCVRGARLGPSRLCTQPNPLGFFVLISAQAMSASIGTADVSKFMGTRANSSASAFVPAQTHHDGVLWVLDFEPAF